MNLHPQTIAKYILNINKSSIITDAEWDFQHSIYM